MIQVIKVNLFINVGDFLELFPEFILDNIRALSIYEIQIDDNNLYYFGEKKELNKLIEILDFTKILNTEKDVTNLYYTGGLMLSEVENEYLIDEFLIDNVTFDDVLDKINRYGVGNLNSFDKSLLATM
jgi:hypothetical protein